MTSFYLLLAWRNLWRNKRRTLITVFAVFFAIVFSMLMRSMQFGSYESMVQNMVGRYTSHIQIHKSGYWDSRSFDDLFFDQDSSIFKRIDSSSSQIQIVPRLESFILAANDEKTRACLVIGTQAEKEKDLSGIDKMIISGSYLNNENPKDIVITEGLSSYMKLQVGDTLVAMGQGYHGASANGLFRIGGIAKIAAPELNKATIFINLGFAQTFFGAIDGLSSYCIIVNPARDFEQVTDKLKTEFQHSDLEIMHWQALMPELVQSIELDNASGLIILFILYLVVGFGIFGTVLMMVSERNFELGVMLSLGTPRFKLGLLLCVELLLLTFIGTAGALIFTYPILWYFNINPIPLTGDTAEVMLQYGMEPVLPFSASFEVMESPIGAILFIVILICLYPMRFTQKINPVEAMK